MHQIRQLRQITDRHQTIEILASQGREQSLRQVFQLQALGALFFKMELHIQQDMLQHNGFT